MERIAAAWHFALHHMTDVEKRRFALACAKKIGDAATHQVLQEALRLAEDLVRGENVAFLIAMTQDAAAAVVRERQPFLNGDPEVNQAYAAALAAFWVIEADAALGARHVLHLASYWLEEKELLELLRRGR